MESEYSERLQPNQVSYPIWQEHINRYYFAAHSFSHKVILDVACGSGYGTYFLSKHSEFTVGIDISRNALDHAKRYYNNDRTCFILADGHHLPFKENVFSTIVSCETIEHLTNQRDFLLELEKKLAKEGIIIISTPNKNADPTGNSKPENPYHTKEFSKEEFLFLTSQFFSEAELYGQSFFTFKTLFLYISAKYFPFLDKFFASFSVKNDAKVPTSFNSNEINPTFSLRKIGKIKIFKPKYFVIVAKKVNVLQNNNDNKKYS